MVRSVRRPERHHPRPPPLNIAPSAPLAHPSPSPGMAWATGVVSCRRRAGRGAARSHLSPLTSPPAAWTRHSPPRACPQTGWTRVAIALDADRRCGRRRRLFRGRGDRDGSRGGPGDLAHFEDGARSDPGFAGPRLGRSGLWPATHVPKVWRPDGHDRKATGRAGGGPGGCGTEHRPPRRRERVGAADPCRPGRSSRHDRGVPEALPLLLRGAAPAEALPKPR